MCSHICDGKVVSKEDVISKKCQVQVSLFAFERATDKSLRCVTRHKCGSMILAGRAQWSSHCEFATFASNNVGFAFATAAVRCWIRGSKASVHLSPYRWWVKPDEIHWRCQIFVYSNSFRPSRPFLSRAWILYIIIIFIYLFFIRVQFQAVLNKLSRLVTLQMRKLMLGHVAHTRSRACLPRRLESDRKRLRRRLATCSNRKNSGRTSCSKWTMDWPAAVVICSPHIGRDACCRPFLLAGLRLSRPRG